jgi:hypothetical protein
VRSLKATQIKALTVNQLAALTVVEYRHWPPRKCVLTTDQRAALSAEQLAVLPAGSPLILDLDGNGIRTTGIEAGTQFDIYADGERINTGWVGSGDGLLVLDRNGDGQINDGSELFGTATRRSDGSRASDGFAALSDLDSNHDGVVNGKD